MKVSGSAASEAARLLVSRRTYEAERIYRPCPHCNEPYSARGMRAHKPVCPKNPRNMKATEAAG